MPFQVFEENSDHIFLATLRFSRFGLLELELAIWSGFYAGKADPMLLIHTF